MRGNYEPMERAGPLGEAIRPEKAKDDPEAYKPIPGRPGWLINGKGQMAREGQINANPWAFRNMP